MLSAVEAVCIFLLPGQAMGIIGGMLNEPAGVFSSVQVSVPAVIATVVTLLAVGLVREGLWGPLRRIVIDDVDLELSEVLREAVSRVPVIFVVQQIIGIFVFLVSALAFLIGLSITIVPQLLVSFTLEPAIYLVSARDKSIPDAIVEAATVTRRNIFAVFGVLGFLTILGMWIGEWMQSASCIKMLADPFVLGWSAITLLLIYRFIEFCGRMCLFVALDDQFDD